MRAEENADRAWEAACPFAGAVTSVERLRTLLPLPNRTTLAKIQRCLDHHCRTFISLSTFVTLATCSADGGCDSSPRGGPPGFVTVLDDHHLLIPESLGNRMADTLGNIIERPRIGMMMVIPGIGETLRINGEAWVIEDAALLARAGVMGKAPALGIGVRVHEAFIHCAKAFMRGALWDKAAWPDRSSLAPVARIIRDHGSGQIGDGSVGAVEAAIEESYTQRLW
jgi:PPOX class probable FMN-dependent enzyme